MCVKICHSLCSDDLALFRIDMCLLLGSPIWYLLFHYCCRLHSRSPHLSQVGMGVRNWSEYNVVNFLITILQTQAVLLLVCAQSPEVKGVIVNCKGRNVPSVPALKSIEYMFSSTADQLCYSATSLHCSSAVD